LRQPSDNNRIALPEGIVDLGNILISGEIEAYRSNWKL
jgi:hypothetical protein